MTKLTLTNCVQGYATLVENEFIDKYMAEANGEYVKVYLLLLRYKCDPSVNLGVSEIADILGYSSLEHFSTTFKKYYNRSPREYRKAL